MGVFVCDYDHNSPTAAYLDATHLPLYRKIREKNPDLPIVIVERTTREYDREDELRRKVTKSTYHIAVSEGDKNVYCVNPIDFFPFMPEEGTVDRVHPTDLGFYYMAEALLPTLEEIARKQK
jgi:lysophospholipase L1-like esterase